MCRQICLLDTSESPAKVAVRFLFTVGEHSRAACCAPSYELVSHVYLGPSLHIGRSGYDSSCWALSYCNHIDIISELHLKPYSTSKVHLVSDAMESTSSSVRLEKRRRLTKDLPGSPFNSVTALAQGQSDTPDCDNFVRQQIESVGKADTENENTEISLSESLSTPRNTSSQSAEIVCFGAVRLPSALLSGRKIHRTDALCAQINTFDSKNFRNIEARTRLQVEPGGRIYQHREGTFCGMLASNNAKLLQLLVNEGLEYDLHWIPETEPKGVAGVIWLTIYGCRQIAEDLGDTLQMIEVYLQDPIYAEKDVLYWNPHRFRNDDGLRTSHLKSAWESSIHTQSSYNLGAIDFLNKFLSEDNLPETEGSAFLRTRLKRCADHPFAKPVQ